jgi:hypothetical protein
MEQRGEILPHEGGEQRAQQRAVVCGKQHDVQLVHEVVDGVDCDLYQWVRVPDTAG